MRCRVFIRDVPPRVSGFELRNLLEESTDGCGEVMMLPANDPDNPKLHKGYALASYESFVHAVDACRRRVTVHDSALRLNVVDTPRPVVDGTRIVGSFEFEYKPTIDIAGEDVEKAALAHTYGLQQALRGYCVPQWCQWTLKGRDCEFGDKCQFIHKKAHQVTTNPKRRRVELVLPEQVVFLETTGVQRVAVSAEDVAQIVRNSVTAELKQRIQEAMLAVNSRHGYVVALGTCTPTDSVLKNNDTARSYGARVDEAVEAVGLSQPREVRLNASVLAILGIIGEALCVRNADEAVRLLVASPKVHLALQEPGAVVVVRPWYPVTPGWEFDVTVTNGTVTDGVPSRPYLHVPGMLLEAEALERGVLSFVRDLGPQLPQHGSVVVHVGVGNAGGSFVYNVLGVRSVASGGQGEATGLGFCEAPTMRTLSEIPQDWIDFMHAHCMHR